MIRKRTDLLKSKGMILLGKRNQSVVEGSTDWTLQLEGFLIRAKFGVNQHGI